MPAKEKKVENEVKKDEKMVENVKVGKKEKKPKLRKQKM